MSMVINSLYMFVYQEHWLAIKFGWGRRGR